MRRILSRSPSPTLPEHPSQEVRFEGSDHTISFPGSPGLLPFTALQSDALASVYDEDNLFFNPFIEWHSRIRQHVPVSAIPPLPSLPLDGLTPHRPFSSILEADLQQVASLFNNQDPDILYSDELLPITELSEKHELPYQTLRHRILGKHKSVKENGGLNKKLSEAQEKAVCQFLDMHIQLGFPADIRMVSGAADHILKLDGVQQWNKDKKCFEQARVGGNWASRFVKRHNPTYKKIRTQPLAAERKATHTKATFLTFFQKLQDTIRKYQIRKKEVYNFDETGWRIGIGKRSEVIASIRQSRVFVPDPDNRESLTSIECIGADGYVLPSFIILSGKIMKQKWFSPRLQDEIVFTSTPTGYTDDIRSFEWLQHFNNHTKSRVQEGEYRLLICDGHLSHFSFDFVNYALANKIIPFCLPPHSTHLVQPLDVTIFQPFKHWHAKVVEDHMRRGSITFTKVEFLDEYSGIRSKTFKKETVLSAFKNCGLVPFNPYIVLDKIKEYEPHEIPPTSDLPDPLDTDSTIDYTIPPRSLREVALFDRHFRQLEDQGKDIPAIEHRAYREYTEAKLRSGHLAQQDLRRKAKMARVKAKQRKASDYVLKTGGPITAAQARQPIQDREQAEVQKLQKTADKARKDMERLNITRRHTERPYLQEIIQVFKQAKQSRSKWKANLSSLKKQLKEETKDTAAERKLRLKRPGQVGIHRNIQLTRWIPYRNRRTPIPGGIGPENREIGILPSDYTPRAYTGRKWEKIQGTIYGIYPRGKEILRIPWSKEKWVWDAEVLEEWVKESVLSAPVGPDIIG
jgi:DDE superfamily endonuclease/Tc5 transposase DNA-binding domain